MTRKLFLFLPDDNVMVFDEGLEVALLAGDVQHHSDGVWIRGCHLFCLV